MTWELVAYEAKELVAVLDENKEVITTMPVSVENVATLEAMIKHHNETFSTYKDPEFVYAYYAVNFSTGLMYGETKFTSDYRSIEKTTSAYELHPKARVVCRKYRLIPVEL